jgi:hypothetical protein
MNEDGERMAARTGRHAKFAELKVPARVRDSLARGSCFLQEIERVRGLRVQDDRFEKHSKHRDSTQATALANPHG